jgi:hypothetical protein
MSKENRINNQKIQEQTIRCLTEALEAARSGYNPERMLMEVMGPLQLICQREACVNAQYNNKFHAFGDSDKHIDEIIKLIDSWLSKIESENLGEAHEATETLRTHYSAFNLITKLLSLEVINRAMRC